jgi:hypothetical protein
MKTPVSESIAQLMPLIDPKGYTAEQFCEKARDQPLFSHTSCEDVAAHWLELAKEGRLAVFCAGTEDSKTGEFKAFDMPWVYDTRDNFVGETSVDILKENFPHDDMTHRHWGVAAEREMSTGKYNDMILPEVLYRWASAASKGKLTVEFENVVPRNPYDSRIRVTMI